MAKVISVVLSPRLSPKLVEEAAPELGAPPPLPPPRPPSKDEKSTRLLPFQKEAKDRNHDQAADNIERNGDH
jgi:hypothetical protein